jgi:hypothetical protein
MVLFLSPCYAQDYEKNEISVFAGGGYSAIKYDLNTGNYNLGYGGSLGLGYTFFFNDFWGIGTGAEIGYYNAKASISSFKDEYPSNDGQDDFNFKYEINGYSETQNLLSVNIPLMLQFQFPLFFDDHLCYFALGGRVGFPFKSTYNSSATSYKTSGVYSKYGSDVELEEPASEGFGVYSNRKHESDLKFQTMYLLSAEVGMKWKTSDHFSLYTGVYLDYGLNDIMPDRKQEYFLKYSPDTPTAYPNESVLNSRFTQSDNKITNSFTNRTIPMALGLKIRLAFRVPDKRGCCF